MAANPVATSAVTLVMGSMPCGARHSSHRASRRARMTTWTAVGIVLATATLAGAQHRHDGGHGGEPHLVAQQCQKQFEQVIADGRGFGLAFVADQEGYPGPLHVLELKDLLRLSPEQERAM